MSNTDKEVDSIISSLLTKIAVADGHSPNFHGDDFSAGNLLLGYILS